MDEKEFVELLMEYLEDSQDIQDLVTFEDEMLLTTDKGVVVYMLNGDRFEVIITKR